MTDKNELNKLLRLNAYSKCKEAIDYFIDSKVVESSTLSFFQEFWNSLMSLIEAGKKHFYKEGSVEVKGNKIIPPKQPTESGIDNRENKITR